MPALNVQVLPDLSPDLDLGGVLALFSTAAELAEAELDVTSGDDDGPFINYHFRAADPVRLWEVLQTQVYLDRTVGPRLAVASIAVCEGAHGWDDYLILHHLDRSVPLDSLESRVRG